MQHYTLSATDQHQDFLMQSRFLFMYQIIDSSSGLNSFYGLQIQSGCIQKIALNFERTVGPFRQIRKSRRKSGQFFPK